LQILQYKYLTASGKAVRLSARGNIELFLPDKGVQTADNKVVIISIMQGLKIAIGGKGGVGKTTVCAIWAQLFAKSGFDVLVIDADPNTTLASAFGVASEKCPEPLTRMKQLIGERTGTGKDAVGTYFRLNPKVSDLPEKYSLEVNGLKLLVLGAITQGGAGCACPEGAFLKALLTHTILQRKELVLVDLAAGVEFLGRASVQGIDAFISIVEPGGRSIQTANNINKMAKDLGINCIGTIANKITESAQVEIIRSQLKDTTLLGTLGYSHSLQEADLNRAAVFGADTKVTEQLKKAKDKLVKLISESSPKVTKQ
jgi:CO dehydrogenase maturation factor